jgi:uncharacterized protein YcnI
MTRTLRVVLAGAAAAALGALGLAAPAAAHVTVNPTEAVQGGYARLAFRVPNESATAQTTKVEVVLPADQPISSVSVMPVPGWTVDVQRRKLDKPVPTGHGGELTEVVSQLTWVATGPDTAVRQGQFVEFPVSVGPLPNVDQLVFKALQTYSDGRIVRWIEEPAPGAAEPEYPAPVLKLKPKAAPSAGADRQVAAGTTPVAGSGRDGTATGIAVAGLVAGLAGLVTGALALHRSRRPTG